MSDLIRQLSEVRPDGARVLSVFVDLDPSGFATGQARAAQLRSLLDRAHEEAASQPEREDVDRLQEALGDPQSMGHGGVKGVAAYVSGAAGLLEVVRLHHRVASDLRWGPAPRLEPLVAGGPKTRWAVVLVDRRHARVLVGDEDGFEEEEAVTADAAAYDQSSRGGPSQGNYERSVGDDVRKHLVATSEALRKLLDRRGFDRLLIGGSHPNAAALGEQLHAYVAERVHGTVDVDTQNTSAADVLEAVRPTLEQARTDHEDELLDRLRAGLGRADGHAVGGVQEVSAALEQGRVEALLLERSGPLSERPEDLEDLIGQAVAQAAEVLVLGDRPDLGPVGGVAALLRF